MKQSKKAVRKYSLKEILIASVIIIVIIAITLGRVFRSYRNKPVHNRDTVSTLQNQMQFTKDGELLITGSSYEVKARIDIETSATPEKQAMGLMFRKEMTDNQGMLFIFEKPDIQEFWMKNTFFSLDMLFVNEKMEIITIHANATPMTENTYASTGPAKYVIEVIAGFCSKNNIVTGDRIRIL